MQWIHQRTLLPHEFIAVKNFGNRPVRVDLQYLSHAPIAFSFHPNESAGSYAGGDGAENTLHEPSDLSHFWSFFSWNMQLCSAITHVQVVAYRGVSLVTLHTFVLFFFSWNMQLCNAITHVQVVASRDGPSNGQAPHAQISQWLRRAIFLACGVLCQESNFYLT